MIFCIKHKSIKGGCNLKCNHKNGKNEYVENQEKREKYNKKYLPNPREVKNGEQKEL